MKAEDIKKLEEKILSGPYKDAQEKVNSGMAWKLEGSVGRNCMAAIKAGAIMLGDAPRYDAYGNRVPSRHEVEAGTKGSPEFVEARHDECCDNFYDNIEEYETEEGEDDL